MRFKNLLLVIFYIIVCYGAVPEASADQQAEVILRALINTGVITQEDIDTAAKQVQKEKGAQPAAVPQGIEERIAVLEKKQSRVPKWVENIKLKGDFRLRHQYERMSTDSEGRNRARVRLRLGAETKVADQVKVAFGLSTGGTDPKSTNQTLQNTFESPDFRLDYAYAEYAPLEELKIAGGKIDIKSYLWLPTDLLWDSDIRPDGGSIHWENSLLDWGQMKYWLSGGVWILDDTDQSEGSDPFMKYVQLGVTSKNEVLEKDVDAKFAVTHYSPQGVKDKVLDHNEGSNSGATTGLRSNYRSLALGSEVGVKELFGELPLSINERIAVFGEFIKNFDDDTIGNSKTTGWAFGAKFGNKKVKEQGTWQLKYIKGVLGKDAWLDVFPDGDRFSGGETDMLSHEVIFDYALKENVILGLDYYKARRYAESASDSGKTEHIMQADIVFKF